MLQQSALSTSIGLRFLTAKSKNGFISFISLSAMLGIAVGITVLLIIMSAMNGFERELKNRLLAVVPHGEVNSVNQPISDWQSIVANAKLIDGVISGAPVISVSGLVMHGNDMSGLQIDGILPDVEKHVLASKEYISDAAWQSLTQQRGTIVLGQGIIDKLQLTVGEQVHLMIPKPSKNGHFKAPTAVSFTLAGSFKFGGQLDFSQAYIHMDDARELADIKQGVSGVRFKFNDAYNAPTIIRNLAGAIDQYVYLSDWTRKYGHLYNDINLVKMITYLVLVLVIGVASFNIVSTLVMAVQDKESEIAILLTMGLSKGRVTKIFMVQGMLNATLGCLLGTVVGGLVASNLSVIVGSIEQALSMQVLSADIYFIDFLPTQFMWQDLLLLVCSTLVISFLATLYPALKAGTIKPALVLGQ